MVGLPSFSLPTNGIKHEQPHTSVHIKDKELGKGTLFITESNVSWVNSCTGEGFSLEYPHIALHAVSRDLNAYPSECLYVMLDSQIDAPGGQPAPPKDDSEDDESDPGMTEMRFVPDDKAMLDAMFHAMTQCQALHPDPEDSASDDDIFEDADEDEEEGVYHLGSGDAPVILSTEQGQRETANGNPQDEPMEMDGQFEDADG